MTPAQFAEVLRDLGRAGMITQTHDGALVLDLKGERLVDHYEFYAWRPITPHFTWMLSVPEWR